MSQTKSEDEIIFLDEKEFQIYLLKLTSCEEAAEVFPDMFICPTCGAIRDENMTVNHRPPHLLIN